MGLAKFLETLVLTDLHKPVLNIIMTPEMVPDTNIESMPYNSFKVNDHFLNSESDPDINFYSDISSLD